jgi:hypothetical protein
MSTAGPIDRIGKIKGTDFIHFYVIGELARQRQWDQLYDLGAQHQKTQALAPSSRETLYIPVESPQAALLVSLVTGSSYTVSLAAWLSVIVLCYAASCALLWIDCTALRPHRAIVVACSAAFPGLYSAVLHGQTSTVSLLCVTVALVLLRRGHRTAAGIALGFMVFKPHWAVAGLAVSVFAGELRVAIGLVASSTAQLVATFFVVGGSVMSTYWNVLLSLPRIAHLLEPRPGDSLKGYVEVLVPSSAIALVVYAFTALGSLWLTGRIWRSRAPFELRAAALVLTLIMISPHVNTYDLVLLAPVLFLAANWLMTSTTMESVVLQTCLYALFAAPLLAPVPSLLRLQLSVGAMATLLFALWHAANRPGADLGPPVRPLVVVGDVV